MIGLLSIFLLIQLLIIWIIGFIHFKTWDYPPVLGNSKLLAYLLLLNGFLLLNRVVQRVYFTTIFYGLSSGIIAIPRMVWANWINFRANWRAYRQVLAIGSARKVAWDKTTHVFPSVASSTGRRPLGQILIDQGVITQLELQQGLEKSSRQRIGRTLLKMGMITTVELSAALAEQQDIEFDDINPFEIDTNLTNFIGERLAFKYSVLPLRVESGVLVLARESAISNVALGVISRSVKMPTKQVIVPQGRVQIGLIHAFRPDRTDALSANLNSLVELFNSDIIVFDSFCSHLVLLGDLAVEKGLINQAILSQALISFEPLQKKLGEHLVDLNILQDEVVDALIVEQQLDRQVGLSMLGC
ncbi:hypothetical protein KR52_11220 [Synechococcus sp. KORDI-52]|nr:hypothetical protein KR52_11220 [Synechococcus sp. KORDI-52]